MTMKIDIQQKVTVTTRAVDKILNLMAEKAMDGHYLRVFVDGMRCSGFKYGLAFSEEPRDDDKVIDANGIRVLVDNFSLVFLNGVIVDFVDTPQGPNFRIENPNEIPV